MQEEVDEEEEGGGGWGVVGGLATTVADGSNSVRNDKDYDKNLSQRGCRTQMEGIMSQ